jgi:hypothetical protein
VRIITCLTLLLASTLSSSVFAYIGPGLGAGTVGVILGVIGSIFLALFAIFWYPLKRLFKKFKKPQSEIENETLQATDDDAASARKSAEKSGNNTPDQV